MALANMTQQETNEHNRNHCKRIAEELEQFISGELYRCPECGEICTITEVDHEGQTLYECSECAFASEVEPDSVSVYDWMEDALDVEYRTDSRKQLRSVEVCVTCGGPNIYVDTADAKVKLYWGSDRAEYPISYRAADALDDWAEEQFACE